jgi:hypothetical protein
MPSKQLKKILILLILFVCAPTAQAQYGHEWINTSQSYYKMEIGENAIYRLDYAALSMSGIPIGSINPKNIQIFRDGIEQYIYVAGEADNSFDAADYIEFHGRYNDGNHETDMYLIASQQPQTYTSLFTDTANYFITWTTSTLGKRLTDYNNTVYMGKTADAWHWYGSVVTDDRDMYDGDPYFFPGFYSELTQGEGLFSLYARGGRTINFAVPTPFFNSSGPVPETSFGAYSKSNPEEVTNGYNHRIQTYIGSDLIFEKYFYGYDRIEPGFNLPKVSLLPTLIGSVKTDVRMASTFAGLGRIAFSYVKIEYPRNLDLSGLEYFELEYEGANDYFSFANYSGSDAYIYDLTNNNRITGNKIGSDLKFNTTAIGPKKLIIASSATQKSIAAENIKPVDFSRLVDASTTTYNYIIITHPTLAASAAEYKAYRETAKGGNHSVLVVYSTDLYNEHFYGLHHPRAIRNFCQYIYEQQSVVPKNLLLLGKGQTYTKTRFDYQRRTLEDLVPTWGTPPSDYFFVTDYVKNDLAPAIPIGRVPARTDEDVRNYLDKLKIHEDFTNESKTILFLTGGVGLDQQNLLIDRQLKYYRQTEGVQFGADSIFFNKGDASAVSSALTEDIQEIINGGVNAVGYFGHGAAQVLEVDIGKPSTLNNEGKYPLFIFNGCALGNSFEDNSLPEEFLLEPKNGGIAWIASSAFGFVDPLYNWTTLFYKNMYKIHYGKSIGEVIKITTATYQNPSDNFNRGQCRQMMYHGDPAIRLYAPADPDFLISPGFTYYPEDASAEMDSIALRLELLNKGRATTSEPGVFVHIKYSNDSIRTFGPRFFGPIYNNKEIDFWIPNNNFSRGQQKVTITIDYGDSIAELAPSGEANNIVSKNLFLQSNSITAFHPPKDGIEPIAEVTLKVQVSNVLQKDNEVIFEIDTTPLFNSPLKQISGLVTGENIIEHSFVLPPFDSTDFYWRARFNKAADAGGAWETNTFSLIYNSPKGWSQGYWSKLGSTQKNNMSLDTSTKALAFNRFATGVYTVYATGTNRGIATRGIVILPYKATEAYNNNVIEVVAVNPENLDRLSDESIFNSYASNRSEHNRGIKYHRPGDKSGVYWFNVSLPANRDSFLYHMNTRIPDGYVVFLVILGHVDILNWTEEMFAAIENCGASKIRLIGPGDPYGLIGIKGEKLYDASSELTADYDLPTDPKSQENSHSVILYPLGANGDVTSEPIGPASQWKEFYYRLKNKGDSPLDSIQYDILGVKKDKTEDILFEDVQSQNIDLSTVSAETYPFIKIKTSYQDPDRRTPLIQKRWTLLYEGIPEGSLMPNIAFEQSHDTIQEGDSLVVKIAYQNISTLSMDSVLVLTVNRKSDNTTDTIDYKKYATLTPDDSFIMEYKIHTLGLSGQNRITVFVNPEFAQPEERLDNNILNLKYVVLKDEKNPLLDVVFDGTHILDFDIVSPTTLISMSVLDDNSYIFIDDPESFEAVMQQVDEAGNPIGSADTLHHSRSNVSFYPAIKAGDKAKLEYAAEDLATGKYNLKVKVKDASGNQSSKLSYEINFEVIRESQITNVYPYPNPFTTSMKFVYTLTGETVPDYMKIQIMTVTGKVVREITQSELGYIKIGNNISEFSWNGTDEFGDQLANGVYLYRVVAKINGEDITHRQTSGDKFFNQGYGKIYLMR